MMSFLPNLSIHLDALIHNYQLCQKLAPTAQIAGVVKNNGYGLGALPIAQALFQKANCRVFFVAYATEGAALRAVAPEATIYLLNGFTPDDLPFIQENQLTPVLSSLPQIQDWFAAGISDIQPALQVETGLHRLGISFHEAAALTPFQRNAFSMILSHLAAADEAQNEYNQRQCTELTTFKQLFPNALFSLSASDGMGLSPDFHFNIIRAGAFLYGLKTCPILAKHQRPVVSASAHVLQTKDLTTGEFVGYNLTFKAKRPTRIAALSIGYGDGLLRSLSNRGCAFFKYADTWHKAPFIGRISMDITMCDVTDIPAEAMASPAFLLNEAYTLDSMGQDASTIGYEVLSALGRGQRWERTYL